MEVVRYRNRTRELVFGSGRVISPDLTYSHPRYFVDIESVGSVSLASLRRALLKASGKSRSHTDPILKDLSLVDLVVTPSAEADEWAEPSITMSLFGSGELACDVFVTTADSPSNLTDALQHLAAAYCSRQGIDLVNAWHFEKHDIDYHYVRITPTRRGITTRQAYDSAAAVYDLCQLFLGQEYSVSLVRNVLRAGRPELLIGQYETAWLECKSSGYDLASDHDKIELGQDVARFANSENGGVLVLGLKTRKDRVGDRIASVHPLSPTPAVSRYHKVLDSRIFPSVEGLELEVTADSPEGRPSIVSVFVPPQPDHLKPFLVTGAIVRGKVEGAFISIVRRREEHSIPIRPEAIHAALSAGRALLRRGQVHTEDDSGPPSLSL